MGAEDFAYMLQAKPGAYCFIANGDGATAKWAMARAPACCTTPATTSTTTADSAGRHLLGSPGRSWLETPRPPPGVPHDRCCRRFSAAVRPGPRASFLKPRPRRAWPSNPTPTRCRARRRSAGHGRRADGPPDAASCSSCPAPAMGWRGIAAPASRCLPCTTPSGAPSPRCRRGRAVHPCPQPLWLFACYAAPRTRTWT
jgi:hypothetical protein